MADPHVERMRSELRELDERIDKLNKFIGYNPTFGTLDGADQALMRAQAMAMAAYHSILAERLARTDPTP